jgi:hypothetical protein
MESCNIDKQIEKLEIFTRYLEGRILQSGSHGIRKGGALKAAILGIHVQILKCYPVALDALQGAPPRVMNAFEGLFRRATQFGKQKQRSYEKQQEDVRSH